MQMKYRQQAEDLELNMSLEPNIDDELWEYDADRIDQVLTNLIDNATRYTQPVIQYQLQQLRMIPIKRCTLKILVVAYLQSILNSYSTDFIK